MAPRQTFCRSLPCHRCCRGDTHIMHLLQVRQNTLWHSLIFSAVFGICNDKNKTFPATASQ
uniref:Uncharacterized protein n=1 Tax=Anguilla anguilla TaxID=7936 RepID=A0A0E9WZ14_ANGAN